MIQFKIASLLCRGLTKRKLLNSRDRTHENNNFITTSYAVSTLLTRLHIIFYYMCDDGFTCYLMQLRIQHETYPKNAEQSSQLTLLVNDLEIRDRLAQSQINKFLYQYTTEAMPRQSHANMVGGWDLRLSRMITSHRLSWMDLSCCQSVEERGGDENHTLKNVFA